LRPHQVLAIERGEKEKVLRFRMDIPEGAWRPVVTQQFPLRRTSILSEQLQLAIDDGAERLLLPAIERDIRRALIERAELHAIGVFAENLRGLLSQPPLSGQTVMGLDPGFRTGTKVAVVDPTGKVLATQTIYPHEPQKAWQASLKALQSLTETHHVTLLSIGNGTASRETEMLAIELIQACPGLRYIITNEAGASVYSASPLARAEMPDLDVSMRGAVSIARRVQDPLAELVKIDPKSIGVGLYQHDVDQKQLADSLTGVVESVVNQVGVDLNTASPALLTYVSGVGAKLAQSIVAFRDENGAFKNRSTLRKVAGLGPKAFEQSAGFLRIRGGAEPLDASAVHPESYPAAKSLMGMLGVDLKAPAETREKAIQATVGKTPAKDLAAKLGVGLPTLKDILEQLVRPGRDPRADLPAPILRSDVLKMEDLVEGMALKGTVRNVVDFGAFVDIGVKHDGLLHRSQVPSGTKLRVGEIIDVTILSVEPERGRIALGWENLKK
jgi:protein Tex